jgi:cytosine/adenosine deaminase-related metal-dependent hydrolase
VDVDTEIGLRNFEGIMAARSRLKDIVSIQVVAFPQSGVVTRPGTAELLDRAVQGGAELIGGIDPAGIDRDPKGQLDVVFGIAGRHGAGVDIHLHDPGELGALQIRMIAERTRALGLAGKVSVSHAFCLGMVDEAELGHLVDLLVDNGISIMTNAPGDRPMPPLRHLRAAGVTVFSGSDGVRDAWTPFGTADMLERAMLLAYRSGFRTDDLLHAALDTVTRGGADVLGLEGYGLDVGDRADVVILPGETLGELVVMRPPRAWVVSAGRVVARDGRLGDDKGHRLLRLGSRHVETVASPDARGASAPLAAGPFHRSRGSRVSVTGTPARRGVPGLTVSSARSRGRRRRPCRGPAARGPRGSSSRGRGRPDRCPRPPRGRISRRAGRLRARSPRWPGAAGLVARSA